VARYSATPWLEREAAQLVTVTAGEVAAALGGLVSGIDQAALTPDQPTVTNVSGLQPVEQGADVVDHVGDGPARVWPRAGVARARVQQRPESALTGDLDQRRILDRGVGVPVWNTSSRPAFIDERCVVSDGAAERAKRLVGSLAVMCQYSGDRSGTQNGFGLRLKEEGSKGTMAVTSR
jgi:hypothetical protein